MLAVFIHQDLDAELLGLADLVATAGGQALPDGLGALGEVHDHHGALAEGGDEGAAVVEVAQQGVEAHQLAHHLALPAVIPPGPEKAGQVHARMAGQITAIAIGVDDVGPLRVHVPELGDVPDEPQMKGVNDKAVRRLVIDEAQGPAVAMELKEIGPLGEIEDVNPLRGEAVIELPPLLPLGGMVVA